MKKSLLIVCCWCGIAASAQQKILRYFNAQWKPCDELAARFVSVRQQTDSGWVWQDFYLGNKQLQMRGLFADSAGEVENGFFYWFHPNGELDRAARYINGKAHGASLGYYGNGMMEDSANYDHGKLVGVALSWYRDGMIKDSTHSLNDSLSSFVSWFSNGAPSAAGYFLHGKKEGKWKYFHSNGSLAMTALYKQGAQLDSAFYDEQGNPDSKGRSVAIPAEYTGGPRAWQAYMESKLYWPDGLEFANGNMAETIIEFELDEDGVIRHAEVAVPFHPAFDKIALKVVQQAKGWQPAKQFNRRVMYRFRQRVTFSMPDDEEEE